MQLLRCFEHPQRCKPHRDHLDLPWASPGRGEPWRWEKCWEICWRLDLGPSVKNTYCGIILLHPVSIQPFQRCFPDIFLDVSGCFLQVNCRCQGGTGFWLPLCRKMTGYCQMDAVIDVYLNQESRLMPIVGKLGFRVRVLGIRV